jgi:hypothetical protein
MTSTTDDGNTTGEEIRRDLMQAELSCVVQCNGRIFFLPPIADRHFQKKNLIRTDASPFPLSLVWYNGIEKKNFFFQYLKFNTIALSDLSELESSDLQRNEISKAVPAVTLHFKKKFIFFLTTIFLARRRRAEIFFRKKI